MECVICKQGETEASFATVTLQRGEATILIKEVPADICVNCDEYYLASEIGDRVLAIAEIAVANNAEFEIFKFVV